ncbi:ParM/StbA family protein [Alicyclobacillus tolerans]|uniref:Plasmid segregation protein ParM n=1 Tax=Alicyclobacillus tolerans TaxID=90970 RepID=A0A1M6TRD2_9BACL|nr:ParM/StbA family protein [Alicyclobacillus montanus]SHK59552.1 plasmid segregation protein ParM [Alicyclobacillus montanus]
MTTQLSLAIDSGKSSTKFAFYVNGELQKMSFRTLVQEVEHFGMELQPNNYLLELGGQTFLVGDMISEEKFDYDLTKQNPIHRTCILLACGLAIERAGLASQGVVNLRLSVNAPVSIYKNNKLKTSFEQFIQNDQRVVSLKINNRPAILLRIETVLALPEGMPMFANPSLYRDKRCVIFDIGSLNVNFCQTDSLRPSLTGMFLSNQGIAMLRAKVAETLTSEYGVSIGVDDAEVILKRGYLSVNGKRFENSPMIIHRILKTHLNEIISFAKSRGITFTNIDEMVFTGGGSVMLQQVIQQGYPNAILDPNGSFGNVLSYLAIMKAKNLA